MPALRRCIERIRDNSGVEELSSVNKLISGSRKWLLLIIIAVIVFTADQVTKQLVIESIPLHTGIEVIPGFFDLAHVRNAGVAFGVMSGNASCPFRGPSLFCSHLPLWLPYCG